MRQAYQTGRGSVTVRAVAQIEETKKGRHQIIVTEIPYGVNKASLVEKIAELYKEKKISISDLRDESSRGKVRVVIEVKKDGYPKKVLNQLYKLTHYKVALITTCFRLSMVFSREYSVCKKC
jgi:DNA gyrase subunit A